MGVAIEARGSAVSCPSSMSYTRMRIEELGQIWLLIFDEFLELGNLSNFLERKDFVFLIAIDS